MANQSEAARIEAIKNFDTIVAGLGAMGSAALFQLSRRGRRVLGLDLHTPANALGSSHGDSRIIRETYFEHPLYVPLVQRAHQLWRELETVSGSSLLRVTGGLMIGPPEGMVVTGTLRSAAEHQLPHEVLSPAQIRARYPAFDPADNLVAVYDPRAGILDPEACVRAHVDGAAAAGAEIHLNEPVLGWEPRGDSIRVTTDTATYVADNLLLSAGAWTNGVLLDIELPLTVERQAVFWLSPTADDGLYSPSRFPIYAYEYKPDNICYGFPRLERGVKASIMHSGETAADPNGVRRAVSDKEIDPLRSALRPVLPGLAAAPVREKGVCLFTNTPDHDFVLDFHPSHPRVLISSCCSGHGFKFASAIGEVQADLLTAGTTGFDLAPFRISRFVSS